MQADDMDLVRQFARSNSDEAFAALVGRHVNLVYSAALRQLGSAHEAEEVTQAVFIILARKAASLRNGTILSGWLYQTARLTAANFQRAASRRLHREHEAFMQFAENSEPDVSWQRLSPLLEEAMSRLGQKERDAVVLRFFENRTMREVANMLGLEEAAVQKRVNRATGRLRAFFVRRGVQVSAVALLASIGSHAVQAAPVEVTTKLTAMAALKGTAVSSSTLTLIKTTLKFMTWTKIKTATVIGVGILLLAGTSTVTVKEINEHWTYPWQVNVGGISDQQVNQPPQVRILHSKFQGSDWAVLNGKLIGLGVQAQYIVASAYGFVTPARTDIVTGLPAGRFDYIACLPGGKEANEKALQAEVKQKFGVEGKVETRDADVWLLTVKYPNASGLKCNDRDYGNALRTTAHGFHGWNESMSNLAHLLEDMANVPVIDQTGLTNRFDFDLNCTRNDLEKHDWEYVNNALDSLGLELVPGRKPIEMLVVEKAQIKKVV